MLSEDSENSISVDDAKASASKIPSDGISFRWRQEIPRYGEKLLLRLDEFRRKNMYYDVVLRTNDATFSAHFIVLAACGGIFRNQNIRSGTTAINSPNTELTLNCSGLGLRTIIKFAYSGTLQLNQENLLATFEAAAVTQMKEIQDICSAIARPRYRWVLKFDGTKSTLPKQSNIDKNVPKSQDVALDMLHLLLLQNTSLSASTSQSSATHEQTKVYPCLEKVENLWPELKSVYISVVDCLRKIEISESNLGNFNTETISKPESSPDETNLAATDSKLFNASKHQAIRNELAVEDTRFNDFIPNSSQKCSPPIPHTNGAPSRPQICTRPSPSPPNSKTTVLSKSESNSSAPPRPAVPNKVISKKPPPRPKPPTFSNSKPTKSEASNQSYDESLNPFS